MKMTDNSRHDFVDLIVKQLVKELPDSGAEAIEPIARFSRLSTFLRKPVMEAVGGQNDLSEAEFNVLAALRRSGPPYHLAPSLVSRSMLFTSGGLTPVLDRLENRGLIERKPDVDDRRKLKVGLTKAGLELHTRALKSYVEISKKLTGVLTKDQLVQLNDLLRILMLTFEDPAVE
ncbi:MAG: MarR family transcriptional regulator [Microbacteriaceae bacterium]|nr:MarR family transcriptional regulator [Cryobacterium sp.]MBX3103987.1 MarR family transcriptional regulator [Cryobacterium sp.]MCC6376326.1 MarR family transcriptional regulator [Microbacteriaceae bacterium]